jgi:4-alpha-glucanotransferase
MHRSANTAAEQMVLCAADLPKPVANNGTADFVLAAKLKKPLLKKAARRLLAEPQFAVLREEMATFKSENPWVLESALFDCLKHEEARVDKAWWLWELPVRDRDPDTIAALRKKHQADIDIFIAVQLLFDRQWKSLKVLPHPPLLKGKANHMATPHASQQPPHIASAFVCMQCSRRAAVPHASAGHVHGSVHRVGVGEGARTCDARSAVMVGLHAGVCQQQGHRLDWGHADIRRRPVCGRVGKPAPLRAGR